MTLPRRAARPARRSIAAVLAVLGSVGLSTSVMAGETTSHALSAWGEAELPADFAHLPYVNPNAPKGGAITIEASGSYDSFNPFILKGLPGQGLGRIYETLMTGSSDELTTDYGLLAETATVPDDGTWVLFTLREGAKFHDGEPVTAEDVAWTFNTLMEKGHPQYKAYWHDVAKVEVVDPRRAKFTFREGAVNKELPLIVGQLPVLPKHWWEGKDFAAGGLEVPMGSGPYRIASFEAGRSIVYERVADYWGAEVPVNVGKHNIDRISIEYFRDRDVATEAFKAGTFDFRAENSAKRWATQYSFPASEAGQVTVETLPDESPTRFQSFFMNTRRPAFEDRKVREALAYAFDFEWTNRTVMYDAYKRLRSTFQNSEFMPTGKPEGRELEILETFRDQLPPEVFGEVYTPPKTDGSGNNRRELRTALKLLKEAGWTVQDGKLRNAEGEALSFELLLVQSTMEALALPMQKNLERLGIEMTLRVVDTSQYINRIRAFDFDLIVIGLPAIITPGNEQRESWHSDKAEEQGSRNYAGVQDPVVDALVEMVIAAPTYDELVSRAKALDRVVMWGHYVIPQLYNDSFRIAYWNRFGRPDRLPRYATGFPSSWWIDPDKDAAVTAWRKTRKN